jgi:rhodanese-related sulfurtransferase
MTPRIKLKVLISMILIGLILLGVFLTNGWSDDGKTYHNISMVQFIEMMRHKDFILINVHIPYQGEIPNTDTLIPFNSLDQHRSQLPKDKDTKIIVYCLTGPMGYIAAGKLVDMGYTSVVHFEGGMQAWVNSGRQLQFRK